MSLINQMLRDLDARQASEQERAGLPPHLRTLPPVHTVKPNAWVLLLVGLVAGALISWLLFVQLSPSPPVVMPSEAVVPVTPTSPALSPEMVSVVPSAKVEVTPVAPAGPSTLLTPAAKLPAAASAKDSRVPRQVVPPAVPAQPASSAPKLPVVQAPKAPLAETTIPTLPAGETLIDKQPKGGQSREFAETEYRKGMQAAAVGDSAAAIPALRRALDIDPRHAKARQALLSVLAANRQWEEVKQVAQSGLALDPGRSGWASILARLQHEQGDSEGAVKTLETYAAHAAGDADYQGLFAFLLHKRQRYGEAAQRYQAALALRPGEGRWWYGLGLALEGAGRGDEAKTAFGKARDAGNLPADMLGLIEQKLR